MDVLQIPETSTVVEVSAKVTTVTLDGRQTRVLEVVGLSKNLEGIPLDNLTLSMMAVVPKSALIQ